MLREVGRPIGVFKGYWYVVTANGGATRPIVAIFAIEADANAWVKTTTYQGAQVVFAQVEDPPLGSAGK